MEQIEVIQKILDRGLAYESNGSVYFNMDAYTQQYKYGELSGKVLEDLQSGSRSLDGQDEKKGQHDFALWKSAKPEHIMKWASPWGTGFPGWHLECTAMSSKYLGVPFDIHGGGMDLQFPHHEGEIAQSFSAFDCKPVNYWMHNNMITLQGQKMAKSKGNFITLDEMYEGNHDLLEQAYSPMTIRFFVLQSHYGSTIDFSNTALQAAEKGFHRLMNGLKTSASLTQPAKLKVGDTLDAEIKKICTSCYTHMSDDFNTAKTIASLFDLTKKVNDFGTNAVSTAAISNETFLFMQETFTHFTLDVLGLTPESEGDDNKLQGTVELLIQLRDNAKQDRNYAVADHIRDELTKIGIQLKDSKEGTTFDVQ
jgi:cysteinyl-tRNA synthetase